MSEDLDRFRKLASLKAGNRYFSPEQSGLEYLLVTRQSKLAQDPVALFLDGTEQAKHARIDWEARSNALAEQEAHQQALAKGEQALAQQEAANRAAINQRSQVARGEIQPDPFPRSSASVAVNDPFPASATPKTAPSSVPAPAAPGAPHSVKLRLQPLKPPAPEAVTAAAPAASAHGVVPSGQSAAEASAALNQQPASFQQKVKTFVQDASGKAKTLAQDVAAHPTTQQVVGAVKKHGPAVAGGLATVGAMGAGVHHATKPVTPPPTGMMHGLNAGHALGAAGLLGGGYALYKGLGGGDNQGMVRTAGLKDYVNSLKADVGNIQKARESAKHVQTLDEIKGHYAEAHKLDDLMRRLGPGGMRDEVAARVDQLHKKIESAGFHPVLPELFEESAVASRAAHSANEEAAKASVNNLGRAGGIGTGAAVGTAVLGKALHSAMKNRQAAKRVTAEATPEVTKRVRPEHMAGLAGLGLLGGGAVHHMATRSDDR